MSSLTTVCDALSLCACQEYNVRGVFFCEIVYCVIRATKYVASIELFCFLQLLVIVSDLLYTMIFVYSLGLHRLSLYSGFTSVYN